LHSLKINAAIRGIGVY